MPVQHTVKAMCGKDADRFRHLQRCAAQSMVCVIQFSAVTILLLLVANACLMCLLDRLVWHALCCVWAHSAKTLNTLKVWLQLSQVVAPDRTANK